MVKSILAALVGLALVAGSAGAQVNVYVPDGDAAAGNCNVIPFGGSPAFSAGMTFMALITAPVLDPANPALLDVAFAPCSSGMWSAAEVLVAVGHVPHPQPCPFVFPGPGGSPAGSFLDLTVIWDSALQGPLSWVFIQDTWSPMGFSRQGGTGFTWNGVDDIGFFITFQNASVVGTGGFRQSGGAPTRSHALGYFAPQSTTCFFPAGIKMGLSMAPSMGTALYQVNRPGATSDVNGLLGTPVSPAGITTLVNHVDHVHLASVNPGQPWDLGFGLAPLVPATGGGQVFADGQILNLDASDPTLGFLNGFFQGPPFQGVTVPIVLPQPTGFSLQMAVFDPAAVIGLSLSQPNRITVL